MDKCSYASLPTVVLWQGNRCLFHEVIHFTVLADIIVFSLSPLVFVWTRAVWYVTEVSLHVLQFTILDLNQQNSSLAYPHSLRDLCTKFSLIFSSTAFQMLRCHPSTFNNSCIILHGWTNFFTRYTICHSEENKILQNGLTWYLCNYSKTLLIEISDSGCKTTGKVFN